MRLEDAFVIPVSVVAREVGNETVILDLVTGTYFGLNAVGARIWQSIGEGKTLAEICDAVIQEYNVVREDFERDLDGLIKELIAKELVRIG